jgi:hypothetical protein
MCGVEATARGRPGLDRAFAPDRHKHIRLADPQRGRFRTFPLAMLDYLAQEWSRPSPKTRRPIPVRLLDQEEPKTATA